MSQGNETFTWKSSGCTNVGLVRQVNEDAYLMVEDIGLWAVADGMGGHEAGDIASKMTIDSLRGLTLPSNRNAFLADLSRRLMRTNDEILKRSEQLTNNGIMGTTIVIFLCYEGQGVCLWAGDSRVYLCRADKLHALTRDHSQLEEMIKLGIWDQEEAERNSTNHVITRAVGGQADLKIDVATCDLQSQDIFLLCSDGLSDVVSHNEIEMVLKSETCQESANALIDLALARGAPDNVTAVVVHVDRLNDLGLSGSNSV